MRRIAMVSMVVALGGCVLESGEAQTGEGSDGDEPLDAIAEAFTGPWRTERQVQTQEFQAPIGSIIRVTAKADDPDRVTCTAKSYSASLIRFDTSGGILHQSTEGIARAFPLNQEHTESWIGVNGGRYRVQFDTTKPRKVCNLHGVVTVEITRPK
jgi:hypothetical protein